MLPASRPIWIESVSFGQQTYLEGFEENVMQRMPLDQAEGRLVKIGANLNPGEEIVFARDDSPVAPTGPAQVSPNQPPRFGTLRGSILHIAPDFDAIPEG